MCPGDQKRRRIAWGVIVALGVATVWSFSPGIPVWWGARASAGTKQLGRMLFERQWAPNDALARADGLGPVFNGRSCAECHFQGGVGGGGTNEHNVVLFEVLPTRRRPKVQSGLVHASAVTPALGETRDMVRRLFPVVPGGQRVIKGCTVKIEDFDPLRFESINTPALFGAGWVDRIASKSITHDRMQKLVAGTLKEFQLDFSSIPTGRPRTLAGHRVGKFGWKGQFATLEEFVAAACANELGLGNPVMDQARPLGAPTPSSGKRDLDRKQLAALVAFVATLPRPTQMLPENPQDRARAWRGEQVFVSIGCAACHTPDVGGVPGIYSDFLLHKVEDPNTVAGYAVENFLEVPLPAEQPRPNEWKTPPLWGVADSAPYFHDGGSATLEEAIRRHGGDASKVTEGYARLSAEDRAAVVAFLKTLRAPRDVPQAMPAVEVRVARR